MDVTQVLAKEIVLRFRKRTGGASAVTVTPELVSFVVRVLLFASPDKDEKGNVALTPEAIEVLAEDVSIYLAGCSTHVLATLSLQCSAHGVRSSIAQRRRADAVRQEAITARLLASLCENTGRKAEEILSEMVFFILHHYGLMGGGGGGGGDDGAARRETAAILSSVFPRSQVRAFTAQPPAEKRRQLEELRRVVWGLRLFHFADGRGDGAGVRPPRESAEPRLTAATARAREASAAARAQCAVYVSALRSPSAAVPAAVREEYHRALQRLIVSRRAAERCADVARALDGGLFAAFDAALEAARPVLCPGGRPNSAARGDALALRDAVPRRVAFPLLVALADAHAAALDALGGLDEADALLDAMDAIGASANNNANNAALIPAIAAESAAAAARPDERSADRAAIAQAAAAHAPAVLYAEDAAALAGMSAARALNGMCPVTLAEEGVAVVGRAEGDEVFAGHAVIPAAGARGQWFVFRSGQALQKFVAQPGYYTAAAAKAATEDPVLVGILDLFERVPREVYISGTRQYERSDTASSAAEGAASSKCDAAAQTGQIDPYMDHNYRWNEWDLRRQALKLANLFNMRTHSTQSIASHFRRDNTTQAQPPRDNETQTMQDAAVQPPRTVRYLRGLRGTESSAVETVQRVFQY